MKSYEKSFLFKLFCYLTGRESRRVLGEVMLGERRRIELGSLFILTTAFCSTIVTGNFFTPLLALALLAFH